MAPASIEPGRVWSAADAEPLTRLPAEPRLRTPTLALRPFVQDDAADVFEAIQESRPSLVRWAPDIGQRRTPADVKHGLESLARSRAGGERLVCGIWNRADGRLLGEVGVHDLLSPARICSVGYWLRESARGRGVMHEALGAIESFAFVELGMRLVQAHIAPQNFASRRVVERRRYLCKTWRAADPQWDGETESMLVYELSSPGQA